MIIDAHAHIMTAVKGMTGRGPTRSLAWGKVRWGADIIQLLPPFSQATAFPAETLLAQMDWAGVDRAALLQGPFYGDANATVAAALQRWPDRFIGAFAPDPFVSAAQERFKQCVEGDGFRIVKFELTEATGLTGRYPDLRIDAPQFNWIFEAAARQGLVVTMDLGPVGGKAYQTAALAACADRYPDLQFVIAHLAQPPLRDPNNAELNKKWEEQIRLGLKPNIAFDLSALPAYARAYDEYPYRAAQGYIQRALRLIGAKKIMWGSDVPGLLTSGTYRQLLNYVRLHCEFSSAEDRAAVLGLNAQRIYWRCKTSGERAD